MFSDMLLIVKYPYAAGVNAIIWIFSGVLIAIKPDLPVLNIVTINMVATIVISYMGFKAEKR